MRITHVVAGALFAGTERYVVEVANGLAARGHTVTVVGGEPTIMRNLLSASVVHRGGDRGWAALTALVRAGRQDMVHAHLPRCERIATLAAPVNRGRRVVTEHLEPLPADTVARRAQQAVMRLATARRIAVSEEIAGHLTPGTVTLLNAVPNQHHVPSAEREDGSPPTVLVAQRLHPQKDTATVLRAWALSGVADDGWRLLVTGVGAEQERLAALAGELGVAASVTFLGWRSDVHALMGSAQVLMAPARSEPLGLTVLEAMSRALPVVASDATGHLETMGSLEGARLFPVGDAGAAAAMLRGLVDDQQGRREYGLALRAVQRERFDQERHLDALEEIYAL